jgi:D-alanine-D-alanine ligase-like ATP-grasp enzyme
MRHTASIIIASVTRNLLPHFIAQAFLSLRERCAEACIYFLQQRGIVTDTSTAESIQYPRARALFHEASKRGIVMTGYALGGKSLDYYRATFPEGREIHFFGLPRPFVRRYKGERWMDDKSVLKKRLGIANIPVPNGGSFSTFFSLRKAFLKMKKPVVLKPRRGSRGDHTTTYIYTENDLFHAYQIAKQVCHFVVLEEHLHGPVYRGTVIDGRVVGVLAGEPPRVIGDGVHTIAGLVEQKNRTRDPLVAEVRLTLPFIQFLLRSSYTLATIIPRGTAIDLSQKIGVRHGGTSTECTQDVHPELVRVLEDAARIVDDPIIGFDFILQDVSKSPLTQRWGIIEANSLPFIHLHDEPSIGTHNNVAKYIWDLWK